MGSTKTLSRFRCNRSSLSSWIEGRNECTGENGERRGLHFGLLLLLLPLFGLLRFVLSEIGHEDEKSQGGIRERRWVVATGGAGEDMLMLFLEVYFNVKRVKFDVLEAARQTNNNSGIENALFSLGIVYTSCIHRSMVVQ